MPKPDAGKSVREFYDAVAKGYHEHYRRENLYDTSKTYPANYFRLQLLLKSFLEKDIRRVVEVGVGEGTPLATLGKAGLDVWGFDLSEAMVEASRRTMQGCGLDPNHVSWGDIRDPASYAQVLEEGLFDGLMAMGVMPHVEDDGAVLRNMSAMIRPGGSVFIEFRNKLFSLFTFNSYTAEFILDDLLRGVGDDLKALVAKELAARVHMDLPKNRDTVEQSGAPDYDAILARFHNPFEMTGLFQSHGFADIRLLWYHYHPAMPYLEQQAPEAFRREAISLEGDLSSWRGYFLCSAFVVEAVKTKA